MKLGGKKTLQKILNEMDLSSIENGVKNPLKFPKSVENQANDKVLNNC